MSGGTPGGVQLRASRGRRPDDGVWLVPCIADIEVIERKPGATRWRIAPASEDGFVQDVLHARETVFKRLARSDEEYEALCAAHTARYNAVFGA